MFMPVMTNAQNKALEKALKKEYKTKMKEYKKEGWKVFGTSRSLEVALLTHYDKLTTLGENGYEVVGICARYKSDNVGHQAAINNACNTYARNAGSAVKGRVVSDMASNGDDTSSEFDHFYAAYETLVEKEIKGELQESYSIYKTLGNGEKQCRPTLSLMKMLLLKLELEHMKMHLKKVKQLRNMRTR